MMFSRISLQKKFLFFTFGLFFVSAIATIVISSYKLYRIVDTSQQEIYSQQIDSILERLQTQHDRLLDTLMIDENEQDFQDGIVEKLRQTYYVSTDQDVYPLIIDEYGCIVLHPFLEKGSASLATTDYVRQILEKKEGQAQDVFLTGQQKWGIFKEFKPWGWIVGFAVPLDVKYKAVYEVEKTLLLVWACVSAIALLILYFFFLYMIKPIIDLTRSSQEMARGNFKDALVINRGDELGVLAKNFESMRRSVKKKLIELEEHKIHLADLVYERTADLERVNEELIKKNQELSEAQQQVLQNEKMAAVGRLSAGVAHEVKNPLAVILLSVESMEAHKGELDDLTRRFIDMVKKAASRANKVVVELLNFSHLSEVKFDEISICKVIDSSVSLVKNYADNKEIVFQTEYLCGKDMVARGGFILLQQVFLNLYMNAVDASYKGGKVFTKVYLEKGIARGPKNVVIMISDQGRGIDPVGIKKIFEPFYTTKEVGQGTGLGLSTVYSIIQRHGGTIDVKSELGQGASFFIRLPISIK